MFKIQQKNIIRNIFHENLENKRKAVFCNRNFLKTQNNIIIQNGKTCKKLCR